jgi:hypothetical protein
VELENKLRQPLISWQTIQAAVTEHVPSERWRGTFEVLPAAATELRKKLLATTDGGPHDSAARVLREIDRIAMKMARPRMSRAIPISPPVSRGRSSCPIPTRKTATNLSKLRFLTTGGSPRGSTLAI